MGVAGKARLETRDRIIHPRLKAYMTSKVIQSHAIERLITGS
jgi:hypothetical protein